MSTETTPTPDTANHVLHCNADLQAVQLHPFAGGTAGVFSTRSPGKTTPNEDSAAILPCGPEAGVLVVADGLGGGASGDRASRLAVEKMAEALQVPEPSADGQDGGLRTAILNGFESANRAVQDLGGGAATTMAVVELSEGAIRPYHVGDCMIVAVGGRGRIKHQTVSHSPVGYAVEAGLMDEMEAMHHDQRHIVSNVVGSPQMHIAIGPVLRLAPRDRVLLTSDGLADNLHIDEIVHVLRKGPWPERLQRIADWAHQRMTAPTPGQPCKPDDLTFIAFRLK